MSNNPMDHTAILRFVEDRFIGDGKYLTARDAAQPNLLDFFDFNNIPWATPPTSAGSGHTRDAGLRSLHPCQLRSLERWRGYKLANEAVRPREGRAAYFAHDFGS